MIKGLVLHGVYPSWASVLDIVWYPDEEVIWASNHWYYANA